MDWQMGSTSGKQDCGCTLGGRGLDVHGKLLCISCVASSPQRTSLATEDHHYRTLLFLRFMILLIKQDFETWHHSPGIAESLLFLTLCRMIFFWSNTLFKYDIIIQELQCFCLLHFTILIILVWPWCATLISGAAAGQQDVSYQTQDVLDCISDGSGWFLGSASIGPRRGTCTERVELSQHFELWCEAGLSVFRMNIKT